MRHRRTLAQRWGIVWPFPRLRYRLRTGVWCEHRIPCTDLEPGSPDWYPAWDPGSHGRPDGWWMIDVGRRQLRRCSLCEYTEFR